MSSNLDEVVEVTIEKRFLAWTDGSARPTNPGFGGFGMFGYTYTNKPVKRFKKHPVDNYFFTDIGLSIVKPETPIDVLDIYEYIETIPGNNSTNNLAEMLAVIRAVEKSLEIPDLNEVTIYSDSSYVVNCYNDSLELWKKNNWRRIDNKEIIHLREWLVLNEKIEELKEKNVTFNLIWVKGHSDNYGNNVSDVLSSIGSNASRVNFSKPDISNIILDQKITYDEYVESYKNKDLIYRFKDLFFTSSDIDDKTYCFVYNNTEKIAVNIGKKTTESLFAINIGHVPDLVTKLKKYYREVKRDYITTCCIKLSKLNDATMLRYFNTLPVEYLIYPLSPTTYSLVKENTPFIYDIKPNMPLITNINTVFTTLQYNYDKVIDSAISDNIYTLDLTDMFMLDNKLKITNMDNSLDITTLVKEKTNIQLLLKQAIYINVGYDIPSYLVLKSVESSIQKVIFYISVNKENSVASLYCKLVLDDRELFITNIVNKFHVKI